MTCGSPRKSEEEEEGEEEAAGPKRSEKSKSWEGSSAEEGMWRWVSLEDRIEWTAFFWKEAEEERILLLVFMVKEQ